MTAPRAPDGAGARRGPRGAIGRVARAGTIACLASVVATAGHAAHPILSEDPGTQGTGGVELEIGYAATRGDAGGRGAELAPQLSIGVAPALDVILRPTWLELRPAAEARRRGMGDSSLDLKWRFHDDDGVQLAVRGGIDLPTGNADRGLGADGVGSHVLVALGVALGPATVLANVGTTRVRIPGERTTLPFASAALVGPAEATLRTFIEVAAQANSDPQRSTWPAVARSGLLWKVGETVDLDVGIAGRLNRVAPSVTLLAGATLHW
jgi:hypothetical protein